jgi:exonuclease III
MKATLNSPMVLNPTSATRITLCNAMLDFQRRLIRVEVDLLDDDDKMKERRVIEVSADDVPVVGTYLDNQQSTLLTRVMAKLGVTGNIGP